MVNKGSHFADFVRFRLHTYTRTQQVDFKKYYFYDRKGFKFFDQILQAAAILDKELKIFILNFFIFNSSFSQNIFQFNITFNCGFATIPAN